MKCFRNELKVYAPTCKGRCKRAVNKLIAKLEKIFEGATIYDARGDYFDTKRNKYYKEPIKVIEIGRQCVSKKQASETVKAIVSYARTAKQDYISVSNSQTYFRILPKEELRPL